MKLNPVGTWKKRFLELKEEDIRPLGRNPEDMGEGHIVLLWIWLLKPDAHEDEELGDDLDKGMWKR